MVLLVTLTGALAAAQDQDIIGIYFDPAYTQDEAVTASLPALVPAYLVLSNPSAAAGVAGWECRLNIDGPGTLLSTNFEGTTINVQTPPDFMVGVSDAPLPGGDQVLLATFNIWVTDIDAVILSLVPLYWASIPDEMAYLNADGSGELLPLATATGDPMVGFINASSEPICDLTPSYLSFPETAVGLQSIRSFTINNPGIVPLHLNVGFSGECQAFSLYGMVEGPLTIQPLESQEISVAFAST